MAYKDTVSAYYVLSKPGIVYANVLTAVAGYLFASAFHIQWLVFLGLIIGMTALIAGACAYNNYLDRDIDTRMARTKKRPSVTGRITAAQLLIFATLMTMGGFAVLAVSQNRLTLLLTVIALIDYVILYGIAKRKSTLSTLIGTVSGALPLVVGYVAVMGVMDATAWVLFLLMASWQMSHFYAIGLYRLKDYRAAKLPIMPVHYGVSTTKWQIISYIGLFILTSVALMLLGTIGFIAGSLLIICGFWWAYSALSKYRSTPSEIWGRTVFFKSLTVLLFMVACLAFGPLLP